MPDLRPRQDASLLLMSPEDNCLIARINRRQKAGSTSSG